MPVRYFLVDQSGALTKASQAAVESAWEGSRPLDATTGSHAVGIIAVVCDDALRPLHCFHARVRLCDGSITEESRYDALHAWNILRPPLDVGGSDAKSKHNPWNDPSVAFQFDRWPDDRVRSLLAVALDVPADHLPDFHLGGPLIASMHLQITIRQALTYFSTAPHQPG